MAKLVRVDPDRLVGAREHLAWTQDELASAAGVGRVTISNLERGLTQPRMPTLRKLARALGVVPADLFGQRRLMHWNYRLVRVGDVVQVAEVYLDALGLPTGWTSSSVDWVEVWGGDPVETIQETLRNMLAACEQPVLHAPEDFLRGDLDREAWASSGRGVADFITLEELAAELELEEQ